jgi:hypothetical protein
VTQSRIRAIAAFHPLLEAREPDLFGKVDWLQLVPCTWKEMPRDDRS